MLLAMLSCGFPYKSGIQELLKHVQNFQTPVPGHQCLFAIFKWHQELFIPVFSSIFPPEFHSYFYFSKLHLNMNQVWWCKKKKELALLQAKC